MLNFGGGIPIFTVWVAITEVDLAMEGSEKNRYRNKGENLQIKVIFQYTLKLHQGWVHLLDILNPLN